MRLDSSKNSGHSVILCLVATSFSGASTVSTSFNFIPFYFSTQSSFSCRAGLPVRETAVPPKSPPPGAGPGAALIDNLIFCFARFDPSFRFYVDEKENLHKFFGN